MNKDSYDIPAYKFAILVPENGSTPSNGLAYQHLWNKGLCRCIPFENVDGLTVDELFDTIKESRFCFVCYSLSNNLFSQETINICTHLFMPCLKNTLVNSKDKQIDNLIEEFLMGNYVRGDKTFKRVSRCFFQRYQDMDRLKTTQRIKKIEEQNGK